MRDDTVFCSGFGVFNEMEERLEEFEGTSCKSVPLTEFCLSVCLSVCITLWPAVHRTRYQTSLTLVPQFQFMLNRTSHAQQRSSVRCLERKSLKFIRKKIVPDKCLRLTHFF